MKKPFDSVGRRQFFNSLARLSAYGLLGHGMARFALTSEAGRAAEPTPPLRLINYSFPNGCQNRLWNFEEALQPMARHRSICHVFRGLRNKISEDVGGDGHLRGGVSLFTAGWARSDNHISGPSLDDIVSRRHSGGALLGAPAAFGLTIGASGGQIRSLVWGRRSWKEDGKPHPMIVNPLAGVFRYFSSEVEADGDRATRDYLVDSLKNDITHLLSGRSGLSRAAQVALGQQMEQVYQLEKNNRKLSSQLQKQNGPAPEDIERWRGKILKDDFRLNHDVYLPVFEEQQSVLLNALQSELVNTGSLMFGNSGDDYFHPGFQLGDHDTSHYDNPTSESVYKDYRKLHMEHLAQFIDRLAATTDASGRSLLDSTIVLVGSEFGDGRAHTQTPQPHLIVGGSNLLEPGKVWDFATQKTPTDLYHTVEQFFARQSNTGTAPPAVPPEPWFKGEALPGIFKA